MAIVEPSVVDYEMCKDCIEIFVKNLIQGDAKEFNERDLCYANLCWSGHEMVGYATPIENIYIAEEGNTPGEAFIKFTEIIDSRLKAKDFIYWRSLPELIRVQNFQSGYVVYRLTARYSLPIKRLPNER